LNAIVISHIGYSIIFIVVILYAIIHRNVWHRMAHHADTEGNACVVIVVAVPSTDMPRMVRGSLHGEGQGEDHDEEWS
jgi:hypothetical protein